MNHYIVIYREENGLTKEERVSAVDLKQGLDYIFKNKLELVAVVKL